MKNLAFALLVLTCALPLRAEDWLQNGDFSDGINHWHGDARSPADFAADNPFAKPDPLTRKGLIVPLKHVAWSKVAQDFKGKISSGILTITYMVAPDLVFSDKSDDYTNIPDKLGWGWQSFDTPPGEWIVFIDDFNTTRGTYYTIKPKLGSSDPQKYQARVTGLTPLEDKTITLAFPPGSGNFIVLSVSITDN
jgi:hypothetical protein